MQATTATHRSRLHDRDQMREIVRPAVLKQRIASVCVGRAVAKDDHYRLGELDIHTVLVDPVQVVQSCGSSARSSSGGHDHVGERSRLGEARPASGPRGFLGAARIDGLLAAFQAALGALIGFSYPVEKARPTGRAQVTRAANDLAGY